MKFVTLMLAYCLLLSVASVNVTAAFNERAIVPATASYEAGTASGKLLWLDIDDGRTVNVSDTSLTPPPISTNYAFVSDGFGSGWDDIPGCPGDNYTCLDDSLIIGTHDGNATFTRSDDNGDFIDLNPDAISVTNYSAISNVSVHVQYKMARVVAPGPTLRVQLFTTLGYEPDCAPGNDDLPWMGPNFWWQWVSGNVTWSDCNGSPWNQTIIDNMYVSFEHLENCPCTAVFLTHALLIVIEGEAEYRTNATYGFNVQGNAGGTAHSLNWTCESTGGNSRHFRIEQSGRWFSDACATPGTPSGWDLQNDDVSPDGRVRMTLAQNLSFEAGYIDLDRMVVVYSVEFWVTGPNLSWIILALIVIGSVLAAAWIIHRWRYRND